MFRDLQKGYPVYILDKSEGHINYYLGTVTGRSEPRFESKAFGQPGIPQLTGDRVVDLTVEYNGKTQTYVVPENGNVASAAAITIACDASFITNEVKSLLKRSEDVIASVDTHKANIEDCTKILGQLNPAIGESQENNRRLNEMDSKIDSMSKTLSDISAALRSLSKSKAV